jgi:hypothetical protein
MVMAYGIDGTRETVVGTLWVAFGVIGYGVAGVVPAFFLGQAEGPQVFQALWLDALGGLCAWRRQDTNETYKTNYG